jgi:type VI secretion system protein ImpE
MKAKELFDQGLIDQAVETLIAEVKSNPADVKLRTSLFEMLCFAGDLDRAGRQLDVLGTQGSKEELAIVAVRELLAAERKRRDVFAGKEDPGLPKDPPEWVRDHVEAHRLFRTGKVAEARGLLAKAAASRPAQTGKAVDAGGATTEFSDLRDGDDFLAPFLEVFAREGRYVWLPLADIEGFEIPPPSKLRDLLFVPVKIQLRDGPMGEAYLPALYAGSHTNPDPALRLGRSTDWVAPADGGDGPVTGVGQHVFYLDNGDRGLLELRSVTFARAAAPADDEPEVSTTLTADPPAGGAPAGE